MQNDIALDDRLPWGIRHLRPLVAVLLTVFLIAAVAIGILDRWAPGRTRTSPEFASLTAASSPQAYERVVFEHSDRGTAPKSSQADSGSKDSNAKPSAPYAVGILPLRAEMFIDSLALEPAYGGLLLLYLVAMRHMAGRHRAQKWDWPLQIACLLVACGVAFDLAENGMTVRAAEDGLLQMLAQPTVDDVHLATQLKWGFIGAAMLAVAFFLRPVTRIHASAWLFAGLWFAVADVPFAAVQSARLNLGETLNATCQVAVGLLFFLALLSIGVGLWLAGEQAEAEG